MPNPPPPQPIPAQPNKHIQETLADLLANFDQISDLLTDILDTQEAAVFATIREDLLWLQLDTFGPPLTRIGSHYKARKIPRQRGNSILVTPPLSPPTPPSKRAQMIQTDTI